MSAEWSHSLLGCADEGCSCYCCLEFVLMPGTYGKIVAKIPPENGACHPVFCAGQFCLPCVQSFINDCVGGAIPPLAAIGAYVHLRTRAHLMDKYNIGHPDERHSCGQFCTVAICKCCSAYQELREMRKREGKHFDFNVEGQAPANQMAHR